MTDREFAVLFWILVAVVAALMIGGGYVAVHFIGKVW